MLQSILVGIEDSSSGIAAQELSLRWAQRFDARLTAMMIVDRVEARNVGEAGVGERFRSFRQPGRKGERSRNA